MTRLGNFRMIIVPISAACLLFETRQPRHRSQNHPRVYLLFAGAHRMIVSQLDGLPQSALAQKTAMTKDELRALLKRLEQYHLIESIGNLWRVQVELTRWVFAGFL